MELLKQPQYSPFNVADQVVSIFAGAKGYMDDLPINQVADFEQGLLQHVHDEFPEITRDITNKGVLSDDATQKFQKIVTDFKARFVSEHAQEGAAS